MMYTIGVGDIHK